MGVVYSVTCDQCGHEFDQWAGSGAMCPCCGDEADEKAPFNCPECGKRINPRLPEFEKIAYISAYWD